VSQVISQFQKEGAKIESVSIGIALDRAVLDQDERERVIRLVSHSVGADPESIAVENFVFYSEDTATGDIPEAEKGINMLLVYIGIGTLILLIIVAAIIVAMLRKRKKKKEALEAEELSRQAALEEVFGEEEIPQITPVKDTRREQIREFAETNPEIVAQMIRSWLKTDGE
jgi:flagellar M-ring protein FliF